MSYVTDANVAYKQRRKLQHLLYTTVIYATIPAKRGECQVIQCQLNKIILVF